MSFSNASNFTWSGGAAGWSNDIFDEKLNKDPNEAIKDYLERLRQWREEFASQEFQPTAASEPSSSARVTLPTTARTTYLPTASHGHPHAHHHQQHLQRGGYWGTAFSDALTNMYKNFLDSFRPSNSGIPPGSSGSPAYGRNAYSFANNGTLPYLRSAEVPYAGAESGWPVWPFVVVGGTLVAVLAYGGWGLYHYKNPTDPSRPDLNNPHLLERGDVGQPLLLQGSMALPGQGMPTGMPLHRSASLPNLSMPMFLPQATQMAPW
jgi:hypothetical protein